MSFEEGQAEMIRHMVDVLFQARLMSGKGRDAGQLTADASKDFRQIRDGVKGNRPGGKGVTAEDFKLVYIGVLRRAMEHLEGVTP